MTEQDNVLNFPTMEDKDRFLLVCVRGGLVWINEPGDDAIFEAPENQAPDGAWKGWSGVLGKDEAVDQFAEFLDV